jgi:hypothetical protein
MYRQGKNITEPLNMKIHFPDSITAEEREWLMEQLREMTRENAVELFQMIMSAKQK